VVNEHLPIFETSAKSGRFIAGTLHDKYDGVSLQTPRKLVGYQIVVSWGGVRPSPLGTSATVWPIVPAPDGG
jgi:hypothetical protein